MLSDKISKHNFRAFIRHTSFLPYVRNFRDANTAIPAMIVETGSSTLQIGRMTVIVAGRSGFAQLFFAPYFSNKTYQKKYIAKS